MATWSRTPLLGRADVRSGTHITSLGADEPGKAELNDDLLAASLVVTDDEQLYGDVWRRSTRRSPGFSGTSGRAAQTQGRSPCTAPSAYPCRTSSPPGTPTNALAPARSSPTSTWSAESSHSFPTGTGRPSSAHARTVVSSCAASSTQQDRSRPERAARGASPRARVLFPRSPTRPSSSRARARRRRSATEPVRRDWGLSRLGRLRHERGAGVRALPARGAAKRTAATVRGFPPRLVRDARGPAPRCRPRWCRCPTAGCPKGWPARRRRCRRRAGRP